MKKAAMMGLLLSSLLLLRAVAALAQDAEEDATPSTSSPSSSSSSSSSSPSSSSSSSLDFSHLAFTDAVAHYLIHHQKFSQAIAICFLSFLAALYAVYRLNKLTVAISALYIYPIKGCAPVALQSSRYNRLGFEHDRRFMLVAWNEVAQARLMPRASVDATRLPEATKAARASSLALPTFLSQRGVPTMCLIEPELNAKKQCMTLRMKGKPKLGSCVIPMVPDAAAPVLPVKVWSDLVLCSVFEDESISAWLSNALEQPVRLCTYFDGDPLRHHRPLDDRFDTSRPEERVHSSFADGYPFLLASTSSLQHLNDSIATRKTEMIAFRPNIVLSGPPDLLPPWVEDTWRRIELNGQRFELAKPCGRCQVPTVLPHEGTRHPQREPIATMRETRAMTSTKDNNDGEVYFGQNMIQDQAEGELNVGDLLTILTLKPEGQFVQRVKEKRTN